MTKKILRRLSVLATIAVVSGCAPQPDPTVGSETTEIPAFPAADRFVECMTEKGWEATRDLQGIQIATVPKEQESQFEADDETCATESGLSALENPSAWPADKKEELYALEVANHECLIALGRPSEAPPTFEAYLEGLDSGNKYMAITEYGSTFTSLADYQETLRACPPPLWFNTMEGL